MALIQWNSTLSIDVAIIDTQHQKLITIINGLHEAMVQGKGKEVVGKVLNELISYTKTHFSTEEKYFEQFGYADTANHKKTHAEFIKKIAEFKEKFDTGKLGISVEIMSFLSDWLQKHIKGTDKQYVQLFHAKGLK
ncbi:MAG: bacteriohemerythrin [Desulfobulbaceae bacterium]|nr:bacteriohemerythrin [Desulfobulbaceae bacterium]